MSEIESVAADGKEQNGASDTLYDSDAEVVRIYEEVAKTAESVLPFPIDCKFSVPRNIPAGDF